MGEKVGGRAWCAWENLLALLGSAGSKADLV